MKKLGLFVLSAMFGLVGIEAQAGYQAIGVYGTGVGANGALLSGGALDPHYTLTTTDGSNPGPNAYVVTQPDPAWAKNTLSSQWINSLGNTGSQANGSFTYTTTFNLTGLDPLTASLTGQLTGDDMVAVYLNGKTTGISIANSTVGSPWMTQDLAYGQFDSFSITSGFQTGVNTLTFVDYNTHQGPAGLQVQISGTANSVPEPASLAMLGLGIAGAGLAARRRRRV